MSILRFVSRLFSRTAPPLVDWPLPAALTIDSLTSARQADAWRPGQPAERAGIQVFDYPFDEPVIATFVAQSWSSPEEGTAADGKYYAVQGKDGTTRYSECRALVNVLTRAQRSAGRGMARLRLIALDRFGYEEEANALFREFEGELGPAMAAMGFARILIQHHAPERALEVIDSARRRGLAGAALDVCQARAACALGSTSDGVRLVSAALRGLPDPRWTPADHEFSWGLLHGAAHVSRGDASLRDHVLHAIESLAEGDPSARRALACATLAGIAGDLPAAARYSSIARDRAQGDGDVLAEAERALERSGGAETPGARPDQPPGAMDTRRVDLGIEGWILDSAASSPRRSTWRDDNGAVLTLTAAAPIDEVDTRDIGRLRTYSRQLAERDGAGLLEANVVQGRSGPAAELIYKKLAIPAFTFTGVQIISLPQASLTWTVVAPETGTTGVREAVVTNELFSQGRLTIESYTTIWARDPYDPAYRGVDRSTLRYMSDDATYDARFPAHPLSRVRRVLRDLSRRPDLGMLVSDGPTRPAPGD